MQDCPGFVFKATLEREISKLLTGPSAGNGQGCTNLLRILVNIEISGVFVCNHPLFGPKRLINLLYTLFFPVFIFIC